MLAGNPSAPLVGFRGTERRKKKRPKKADSEQINLKKYIQYGLGATTITTVFVTSAAIHT
jgi:hypothetical protein